MHTRIMELSKEHNLSYGDVLEHWEQAKKDAKRKRLKSGSPRHYEYAFQRLEEIVSANSKKVVADTDKKGALPGFEVVHANEFDASKKEENQPVKDVPQIEAKPAVVEAGVVHA